MHDENSTTYSSFMTGNRRRWRWSCTSTVSGVEKSASAQTSDHGHAELMSTRNTELVATTERDQPRFAPVGWMSAITERLDALWRAFHRSQRTTPKSADTDDNVDGAGTSQRLSKPRILLATSTQFKTMQFPTR